MKDDTTEGCGYGLTFRGWAKAACRVHDMHYLKDSWAQKNLTRKEADEHFLNMLLTLSGSNLLKRLASHVMYRAVRLFGSPFWEGKR